MNIITKRVLQIRLFASTRFCQSHARCPCTRLGVTLLFPKLVKENQFLFRYLLRDAVLLPVPDVAAWLELTAAACRGFADGSPSSSARAFPIANTSGDCGNAWTTDTQACHSVMTYDMQQAVSLLGLRKLVMLSGHHPRQAVWQLLGNCIPDGICMYCDSNSDWQGMNEGEWQV